MCDPVSIGLGVTAGVGLIAGTTSAVMEQEAAVDRKKAADKALSFETAESAKITRDKAEQTAEESFELAREAAVNRGLARNSGLGVTSVRALSQAVGFQLGQDRATLDKNMRTANADASARLDAANQQRESEYGQAGDTTGLRLGLNLGASVVTAAVGFGAANAAAQSANAAKTAASLVEAGTASAAAVAAAQAAAQAAAATAQAWSAGFTGLQIASSGVSAATSSSQNSAGR